MLAINIITSVCLAAMLCGAIYVLISLFTKKRAEQIEFLRSFKKGKCIVIFLAAIPLYVMANLHAGKDVFYSVFKSIGEVISLVVLQYSPGTVSALMADSLIYRIAIYVTYVLVLINAIIFTLSVVHQYVWSRCHISRAKRSSGDKLFILGVSPENVAIYKSDEKRIKIIVGNIPDGDKNGLYIKGVAYDDARYADYAELIVKQAKAGKGAISVIVNTGSDDDNISVCREFADKISGMDDATCDLVFGKLYIYVFGDARYESIYDNIVKDGRGCIRYVNKYKKIAMNFVDNYPITRFMDERHIDYSTSLVRPGVDVNVVMIGFGKTNHQIFLASVANNQFLEAGEGDPILKKVKYFIFDKKRSENDKNLNHSYYRFKNETEGLDEKDYLPFPSLPAEEYYECLDINSCDFYGKIKSAVTRSSLDVNIVVIAFGTDLENIDMAEKLIAKRGEWGLDNLTVFVKVRSNHKADSILKAGNCFFIGNEADEVYSIDRITGDAMNKMAMLRNEVYDLEYDITHGYKKLSDESIRENHDKSTKKWYREKSQMERDSSLYCCLSLRSKLNLMGLDYVPGNDGMSYDEYIEYYAGDDKPDDKSYGLAIDGKPVVKYTLDFPSSRRRNLAVHEHLRWNSFMISRGIVPASKDVILKEKALKEGKLKHTNGKNYAVRRHGNLTTFDGLVDFRKMIAARDSADELECDVIKYDYQLLDDAVWLLDKCGYKIVARTK